MTGWIVNIWRYPIKAHGREPLEHVELIEKQTMPWDRAWAVPRVGSSADGAEWVSCGNFSRAAKNPALQAIETRLDEGTGELTLIHPDRPTLAFNPDRDQEAFVSWVTGLGPDTAPRPARLVKCRDRGMTDTAFASISLLNAASHRAVAQKLGRDIQTERWRGNYLIDGLAPWEEFEWVGKRLRLGGAVLKVIERIGRCQATSVDTNTGKRDTDMLNVLSDGWGHTDFGVYAEVETGGDTKLGDGVELLP